MLGLVYQSDALGLTRDVACVQLVAEDPERFDDPDEEGDFEDEEEEAHPNNVSHPTRPEQ